MALVVMRTTASVGWLMEGSGTDSTPMSPIPRKTTAFMG